MNQTLRVLFLLPAVGLAMQMPAADLLDIAPFGHLTTWNGAEPVRIASAASAGAATNIGVEWDEERDVRELHVGAAWRGAAVEYWFKNWPYEPPHMPTIEDPMDDPWQGKWLRGSATEACDTHECVYRFRPLTAEENPLAKNLPGVPYRRTLKVRLVFPAAVPAGAAPRVFTGSEEIPVRLQVELGTVEGGAARWSGSVTVFNGSLRRLNAGADPRFSLLKQTGALDLELLAAKPDLPGSHDATVVTVHALRTSASGSDDRTFSFAVDDLRTGPIRIPDLHVQVTGPDFPVERSVQRRTRIRQRLMAEPEQTYERASREIPPLDPWDREWGGRLYLPLAPDSQWQKFAFEYGGDVYVSKTGIKAKGKELSRLQWSGDRITWRIGTGSVPDYREGRRVTVRKLDDYLPVVTQRWDSDGLAYAEEAFATVLRGPLSPEDPLRDEETPAVLMLQVRAENPSGAARKARVLLSVDGAGQLALSGSVLRGDGRVVAHLSMPDGTSATTQNGQVAISFDLPPGTARSLVWKLPCVSDLDGADISDMGSLNWDAERARVISYWRSIIEPAARFRVPEQKFNLFEKTVVAHIHISTTKDPKTGLYIVPAASYGYDSFPNEACYQVLLLDTLGQFRTATEYLETMLRLQGSRNFPGAHKGPADGIFHGTKIDSVYDYTAHGYGLDHGTILWTLAEHYRYTRDRAWFEHAWPHMRKAIEWVEQQRTTTRLTGVDGRKVREYGLLPASQLEDDEDWANWFSINAYAWAGMAETAEDLAEMGSPEAPAIRQAADAYRTDLRAAVMRAVQSAPAARMQDGTYEPYVPVLPTRRFRLFGAIRAAYYLRYGQPAIQPLMRLGADRDTLCGAMVLLTLGVFSPDEPIAGWILDDWEDNLTLSSGMGLNIHGMTDDRYWFSQGGMVFQPNLLNPITVYLKRHEAQAAMRNLYNDFVACLYPEVNVLTEEFHQWRHASGLFYKVSDEARFVSRVRDLLVLEDGEALWLASGAPRRWLASKDGITVDRLETKFGPVSYRLRAGETEGTIEASVTLPPGNREKAAWLAVRAPAGHIQSVLLNGRPWERIDRRLEAVELPVQTAAIHLEIRYR